MYVGDILGRRALYSPDAIAIVDASKQPHRIYTYADLNQRANRLASWFANGAGMVKGDRVAVLAHNGVEYLDTYFASNKIGAIMVGLNWRLNWREQLQLIEDTAPRTLIFSEDFLEDVGSILDHTNIISHALHIEGHGLPASRAFERTLSEAPAAAIADETVTEEDISCLIFTGGTTGIPKAARISHRMIAWNTLNTVIHDLHHDDVTVNSFPLFHTGGLLVYTVPLLILGGTVVLTRRFDAAETLSLLEEYSATVYAGVPTMYQMMVNAPNWAEADLSSLRFCTSGGAPLPVSLVQTFEKSKQVRFKQGFGMSEFGPGVFALAQEDAIAKAGSIGRPNFFVDARVVDDQNQPVPNGQPGELVLRGPSLCSGYFHAEGAVTVPVDAGGWFHTGDIATVDDASYFTIVDRKKDMFISGGENIYPAEIEKVLYTHPSVSMCAVVGAPDEKWGEIGVAFVVVQPDRHVSPEELIAYMHHHLAGYKVPKVVEICEELPISSAGKILKRELRRHRTERHTQ